MAYATHTNVSNFMQMVAFSAATNPTDTIVTAGIVQADAMIDAYLQGRTAETLTLQVASCMIVQGMVMRARKYQAETGEALDLDRPLMTSEVKALLDRDMDTSSEIPLRSSNLSSYQTSASPDDFV
jgi:hypothetical protein